jgi:hypothetical protein
VLGSFIFGLPSDREHTFDATLALAEQADLTFAQFVLLTPFPGTIDFEKWTKDQGEHPPEVSGVAGTPPRVIPENQRPQILKPQPTI